MSRNLQTDANGMLPDKIAADTPLNFLINSLYIEDFVQALDAKSCYFLPPSLINSNSDRGREFRVWEIESTLYQDTSDPSS